MRAYGKNDFVETPKNLNRNKSENILLDYQNQCWDLLAHFDRFSIWLLPPYFINPRAA